MEIEKYLESTDDASKRSRGTIILLVVACVLGAAGLLNSIKFGWIHQRLEKAKDLEWVATKLGYSDAHRFKDKKYAVSEHPEFEVAYQQFVAQVIREYAENAMIVKVPVFGVGFDVNDLGMLAGIGFAIILTLLWYSLRNECVAVQMGFDAAKAAGVLAEYYNLLATKQVFTVPHVGSVLHTIDRRKLAVSLPRAVIFLPAMVQIAIFVNDFATLDYGTMIGAKHSFVILILTVLFLFVIIALAFGCWTTWRRIDGIWDATWSSISPNLQSADHYSI